MKNLTDDDLMEVVGQIDDVGRKFLQHMSVNRLSSAINCLQHVVRIYRNDIPGDYQDVLYLSSWNPQVMQMLLQRCVTERYRLLVQTAPASAADFSELRLLIEASRNRAIADTDIIPALPYPKGWRSWERKHNSNPLSRSKK